MKTTFFLFVLQLFFCQGCVSQKTNPNARKVVEDFYNWYISDAYKNKFDYYQVPPFKNVGERKYVFDKEELKRRLLEIKYFSKNFRTRLLDKLDLCNDAMSKLDWDFEPEPQFNISQCNYLWFDNWIGGQGENINGFRIVKETNDGSNAEFIVEILINEKVFTKSKVQIEQLENNYLISDIVLIWN